MTVGLFRLTQRVVGKATILETNMSQTIGSASSSLASGIIFTLPALFLWGLNPTIFQMAGLAVLGGSATVSMRLIAAPLIALFAFFFVTVSSRIVGLVGVTSNPTSGMTIVTLIGISLVFVWLGWTDMLGMATVLTVGTVVCVAASIAGDTSQDLKTGFLVGATPYKQQIGELIGASTSALAVCASVVILHNVYGFGTTDLPAPQAMLVKTIVEGLCNQVFPGV